MMVSSRSGIVELKGLASGQAQSRLAGANTNNDHDHDFGHSSPHLSVPLYLPRRPPPPSATVKSLVLAPITPPRDSWRLQRGRRTLRLGKAGEHNKGTFHRGEGRV